MSPQLTQELKESKPAQSEPTPDVHKKVAFILPAGDSPPLLKPRCRVSGPLMATCLVVLT